MEYTTLSNGVKMPMVGYGVYQVSPQECERCVLDALGAGYRSLDTAQSYFNEAQVGSAIRKSGVPREDIFLTTKVWVEHYGQQAARASVLDSMEKLGVDYLDLALLHQAAELTQGVSPMADGVFPLSIQLGEALLPHQKQGIIAKAIFAALIGNHLAIHKSMCAKISIKTTNSYTCTIMCFGSLVWKFGYFT